MPEEPPVLDQLKFIVTDMAATLAFYRHLGLPIEAADGARHVEARLPNGLTIEWDAEEIVPGWDGGWRGDTGGSTLLGFSLRSREAVDRLYADLTTRGYRGHQAPYDAFWGRRLAIVDDPDGNPVAIMSPVDPERRSRPSGHPPAGA